VRLRALLGISLVLAALAAWVAQHERRAARATADYDRDLGQLTTLLAGRAALQTSVLEARAGLVWSFDPINRAVLVLRAAATEAEVIRGRGPAYGAVADALTRTAEALRSEEASLETFKTDLALLRLSARYFPLAADALTRRTDGCAATRRPSSSDGDAATLVPERATSSAHDQRIAAIGELRTNVERYEESPTREIAQRLEATIPALEALRPTLDEAVSGDLDVLLGHTRAILDRRERLDRFTRTLVRSPVRVHVEAAHAAYQRAARAESARLVELRLGAFALALASLLAMSAAVWTGLRGRRHSH
jgi:DAHL domain